MEDIVHTQVIALQAAIAQKESEKLQEEQQHFMSEEAKRVAADRDAAAAEEENYIKKQGDEYSRIVEKQVQQELNALHLQESLEMEMQKAKLEEEIEEIFQHSSQIQKLISRRHSVQNAWKTVASARAVDKLAKTMPTGEARRLLRVSSSPATITPPQLILVMTVDLGEGKSAYINVYDGDNPHSLALLFVKEHGLMDEVIEPLTQCLIERIDEVEQEMGIEKKKTSPTPREDKKMSKKARIKQLQRTLDRLSTPRSLSNPSHIHSKNPTDFTSPTYKPASPLHRSSFRSEQEMGIEKKKTSPTPREDKKMSKKARIKQLQRTLDRLSTPRSLSNPSHIHSKNPTDFTSPTYKPASPLHRSSFRSEKKRAEYFAKLSCSSNAQRQRRAREMRLAALEEENNNPFSPKLISKEKKGSPDTPHATTTLNAFNRLYTQATQQRERHLKAVTAAIEAEKALMVAPSLSAKTVELAGKRKHEEDIGKRLYKEGMKRLVEKRAEIEKEKEERQSIEAGYSFSPSISSAAKKLKYQESVVKRMEERVIAREKEQEQAREAAQTEKLKDCTFRPKLETSSVTKQVSKRRESQRRQRRVNVFDLLTEDAKRRMERTNEYHTWFPKDCTFSPDIKASQEAKEAKLETVEDRLQRLSSERLRREAELEAKRLAIVKEEEEELRRSMVKPCPASEEIVSRMSTRRPSDLSATDILYLTKGEHDESIQRLVAEEENKALLLSSVIHTSEKSDGIVKGFRRRQLALLFELIDDDEDGVIIPTQTNISIIEDELARKDVEGLFGLVGTRPLSVFEFVALMEEFIITHPTGPRLYLVPRGTVMK
ncbi:hypothetical protein ADUPG1_006623 [Aduncisulcus paluster]|uniref:Uncharacterized protein n=1 Tax=Aduncisulcus paluster TaxID=2918883 RepID=A0ABQ5KLV0_9EUKA|nr:hypothetical protein ADUPG1_006623 [Aduncisulcus paluster]